jgi:hypothetical protein
MSRGHSFSDVPQGIKQNRQIGLDTAAFWEERSVRKRYVVGRYRQKIEEYAVFVEEIDKTGAIRATRMLLGGFESSADAQSCIDRLSRRDRQANREAAE